MVFACGYLPKKYIETIFCLQGNQPLVGSEVTVNAKKNMLPGFTVYKSPSGNIFLKATVYAALHLLQEDSYYEHENH